MRRLHLPAATAIVGVLILAGCAAPTEPAAVPPVPTPTPTSEPEPLPLGSIAIDSGCASLVDLAAIAVLAPSTEPPVEPVVDENRLEQGIEAVAARHRGELRCIWSSAYGDTGYHRTVTLAISPSDALRLDPAAEARDELYPGGWLYSAGWEVLPGTQPTLAVCADVGFVSETEQAGSCRFILLLSGFRIDFEVHGIPATTVDDARAAGLVLLDSITSAVASAGPPRNLTPSPAVAPATRCTDPSVIAVVAARGGSGERTVSSSADGFLTCTWSVPDQWNPATILPIEVSVLTGGAWAYDLLAAGAGAYPLFYVPSEHGPQLIGSGDWLGALVRVDGDLLEITAPGLGSDDDTEAWARAIAANF